MKKIYKKKRRVRKILLQKLYALDFSNSEISFKKTAIEYINFNKIDYVYLNFSFDGILKKKTILNFLVNYNFSNYNYFNFLDKIIIRIAIFEVFFNFIPLKVIISESIELAKLFSSKNSYIFINKILNSVIKGYIFNNKFFL